MLRAVRHTVNFKTRKHFKDKKSHYVDKDQRLIFEDTHEPIIDQKTFDNVQRIRGQVRRYPDGWGEAHPLTGLMYCADCGGKMYVHRVNNGKRVPMYVCGNYAKQPVGTLCRSAHRIKADHVMEIVAKTIKEVIQYANLDKERFVEEIQSHIEDSDTKQIVSTTLKKLNSLSEESCMELTTTTKRRKLTERDHSIKERLAKANEQSKQQTVTEGKKRRTHSQLQCRGTDSHPLH